MEEMLQMSKRYYEHNVKVPTLTTALQKIKQGGFSPKAIRTTAKPKYDAEDFDRSELMLHAHVRAS